jgi:hypothetical protein
MIPDGFLDPENMGIDPGMVLPAALLVELQAKTC